MNTAPVIGVLALQGDVAEHVRALNSCGAIAKSIKTVAGLDLIDGLVIPGGESTTIGLLARREGLLEPLRDKIKSGLPTLGTCAGLIFLARDVVGAKPDQDLLGVLDVKVRRNAFGRQVDSFERPVEIAGWQEPFPAVFIRAPWVDAVSEDVEILATTSAGGAKDEDLDKIIMVRQSNVVATAFHPELTTDPRVHQMICHMANDAMQRGA